VRSWPFSTSVYESGLLLQDTTYATTSPLFRRYSESYAGTDLIDVVPIRAGMSLEAGVKNLLDRNYCYTAGYPASSRSVTLWRDGIHVLTKFAA